MKSLQDTRDELLRIRFLMDIDVGKSKQMLTNLIKDLKEVEK